MLTKAVSANMALLSGLELLFVVLIVGFLFIVNVRVQRKNRFSLLPFLIIGFLLLAIFHLSGLLVAFFTLTVLATLVILVLLAIAFFRLGRR